MDFFSNGAMPMGALFFGLMVLGVVRRKTGSAVARAQYPKLGERLGLTYTTSNYKGGVGKLQGTLAGYRVTVDPDDQRRIYVRFDSEPQLELHSFVHNKRSPSGTRAFRPASPVLAAQFKTAHASPAIIERLNRASGLSEALRPLRFLRALKTLSASPQGITAVFDYGNPPYIPAEVVDDVLPRLLGLARVIEGSDAEGGAAAFELAALEESPAESED